jgi:hypothetical protein
MDGMQTNTGGGKEGEKSHESAENEPPAVLPALTLSSPRDLVHVTETSSGIQRAKSLQKL